MKVILYMATTVDGMIAKENDDTSFVSETEWKSFRLMIQRVGNIIIGERTYKIMEKGGEFKDMGGIRAVAVSHDGFIQTTQGSSSVVRSPKEALELLEKEGFQEALVAGGGQLNGSFMEENLIDELYLDIEPIVLGKGIKLFNGKELEIKLELIETRKLSENAIQLHYRVLRGVRYSVSNRFGHTE
jgi:dihydrofolate reductase